MVLFLTSAVHCYLSLETVDSVQSGQFLDDRILQCIKQYADKIKCGVLNTSKLLKELLSWKVLSTEDYTTCFSNRNFLNEAVDYVIRHLIQEKNRVKTRIFLHVLSELKEVEPKLATWIQKLNSFGMSLNSREAVWWNNKCRPLNLFFIFLSSFMIFLNVGLQICMVKNTISPQLTIFRLFYR